jgi:hypothetical protein
MNLGPRWSPQRVVLLIILFGFVCYLLVGMVRDATKDSQALFIYVYILGLAAIIVPAITVGSSRAYIGRHKWAFVGVGIGILAFGISGFATLIMLEYSPSQVPIAADTCFAAWILGWMVAGMPWMATRFERRVIKRE